MTRNSIKAAALAVVAAATLAAPAAQAGGYKHKGFHVHHSPVIVKHYGYRHYYRPVVVYKVVEPSCYNYKWVWKHGYKHKVCVW